MTGRLGLKFIKVILSSRYLYSYRQLEIFDFISKKASEIVKFGSENRLESMAWIHRLTKACSWRSSFWWPLFNPVKKSFWFDQPLWKAALKSHWKPYPRLSLTECVSHQLNLDFASRYLGCWFSYWQCLTPKMKGLESTKPNSILDKIFKRNEMCWLTWLWTKYLYSIES